MDFWWAWNVRANIPYQVVITDQTLNELPIWSLEKCTWKDVGKLKAWWPYCFFKVHLDFMNTHTTCITYPSNCEGKWIQCFNEIQDGGIAVTLNVYGQLLQSPDFLWIIPSIAQFLCDACGKVGNADQQGFWLVSWASDKDKDKDVPIDPMRRLKLLYITGNFQSWIFLSAIFNFSSLY